MHAPAPEGGVLLQPAAGPLRWRRHESPLGSLLLAVDAQGALAWLRIGADAPPARSGREWRRDEAACEEACRQIDEYFAGRRHAFRLALAPAGTPFQRRVWRALLEIPAGTAITYGELARRIGRPGAARAVGRANGANPVPLVIPCHRVVAANGLGGYSGGGEKIKRRLLELEGCSLERC